MGDAVPTRRVLLTAAASFATARKLAAAPRSRLTLATGASGGGFHEHGPALAGLVARHAPVDLDLLPTGGSHDNVRLVGAGDADLGLVSMGTAWEAWQGRPPFETAGPYRMLRALFPLYGTPFGLVVPKRLTTRRFSDLAGARVGAGPTGGSAQVYLDGLAAALGLRITIVTGAPADLAARVVAGEVDALWFGSGTRIAAVEDVLERGDGRLVGLASDEAAAFRRILPFAVSGEIPAGTYRRQDAAVATVAVWAFAIASERLADSDAYRVVRAVMENAAAVTGAYPRLVQATVARADGNTFLPFHPGAARYYAEAGVQLPSALRGAG